MADNPISRPQPSLFARKGEAEPAPAVAYVSLRQMQGKPDRRETGPDRRSQMSEGQGEPTDHSQRRLHGNGGTDHDGRRHFTPRSGLAQGQEYVPWKAPESHTESANDSASTRKRKQASNASVSALSSLIHRHQDGVAKAVPIPQYAPEYIDETASPDAPSPEHAPATPRQTESPSVADQAKLQTGPTKVDMSYLSAAAAPGRRPPSPKPTADKTSPRAAQPPRTAKRLIKRKKVTVRLEVDQFLQIKALVDDNDDSYQRVMSAAVSEYLKKIT